MSGKRRHKLRIVDITNYKSGVNFECDKCGYICHGERGMKLHVKYTHGVDKKRVDTDSFCNRCNKTFTGDTSKHMIQHRGEI